MQRNNKIKRDKITPTWKTIIIYALVFGPILLTGYGLYWFFTDAVSAGNKLSMEEDLICEKYCKFYYKNKTISYAKNLYSPKNSCHCYSSTCKNYFDVNSTNKICEKSILLPRIDYRDIDNDLQTQKR